MNTAQHPMAGTAGAQAAKIIMDSKVWDNECGYTQEDWDIITRHLGPIARRAWASETGRCTDHTIDAVVMLERSANHSAGL